MRESLDQHFDAEITRALKFKPLVTPRQKQAARERLLARAAGQPMLLPIPAQSDHSHSLRQQAYAVRECALRVLKILFFDASIYERARRPIPPFYGYYNLQGRYTVSIIHLSA